MEILILSGMIFGPFVIIIALLSIFGPNKCNGNTCKKEFL